MSRNVVDLPFSKSQPMRGETRWIRLVDLTSSRRRSRRWWVDACHPCSPVPSPKSPIFVQLRIQCFALELLYFDVIRVVGWNGMRTCTSIQVIFIEVASEYFCLSSANRQALWQATLFKSSPLRV